MQSVPFASTTSYRLVLVLLTLCGAAVFPQVHSSSSAQPVRDEEERIMQVLELQRAAWNRGDLLEFMETYWKDDRLTFSGGGQTMRGWQATLERYQQGYPRDKMGQLKFEEVSCDMLGSDAALVLGNWHLDLNGQQKQGNFSLVLRKFGDRWLIIHDHSSTLTPSR